MLKKDVVFQAEYLIGAAHPSQFPKDATIEIAFIGRSNSGKSTALNTITGCKGLARVSKTPGRTQLINYFTLRQKSNVYLVDLPGYGYAKISAVLKQRLSQLITHYLSQRKPLKAVVLLMDSRHPLRPNDLDILNLLYQDNPTVAVLALLTKADKLSATQQRKTLFAVNQELSQLEIKVDALLFSATHKTGLAEAHAWLSKIVA